MGKHKSRAQRASDAASGISNIATELTDLRDDEKVQAPEKLKKAEDQMCLHEHVHFKGYQPTGFGTVIKMGNCLDCKTTVDMGRMECFKKGKTISFTGAEKVRLDHPLHSHLYELTLSIPRPGRGKSRMIDVLVSRITWARLAPLWMLLMRKELRLLIEDSAVVDLSTLERDCRKAVAVRAGKFRREIENWKLKNGPLPRAELEQFRLQFFPDLFFAHGRSV